jgi:glycosyltransferase involved in cell wall biosynthesis/capsular polysaccharide biosynthesis protein
MTGTDLRVLHLISEMGVGGAESLVVELVRRGHERGWVCAVASSGGVRADELTAEGVATYQVPAARRSPLGVLRAVRQTRAAVRGFRPDVVLAHNVGATVVARLAVGDRTPVVTVFHGVAAADYRLAARLLGRLSGAVVAVSGVIAQRLRAAGLTDPDPVVVRNAVSARPGRTRAAARRRLRLGPAVPVALCLARLVPQKRHDVLIDAWAQLVRGPGARSGALLLIAGDGPLLAELKQRVAARGLAGSVRFLGNRDDVPDLLAAADLTVLTSDWEGLPISVIESLAAGRPVVASNVDGVAEVLAGGAGTLTPPGQPGAVAEALGRLLTDRSARTAAAAAGRRRIARDYDPSAMVASYEDLLTRRRPTPRPLIGRRSATALLTAAAVLLVGGATYGAVAAGDPQYQGRIGLVAAPVQGGGGAVGAQFGEVVQLGMPAVAELVRTPTVLDAAAAAVPGTDTDELADAISVEYVPETGVARLAVRADTAEHADVLALAVARGVVSADLLAPVARLRTLDDRADVSRISPDGALAAGLALVAAVVAALGVLSVRHLVRPSAVRRLQITDALTLAGASRPVTVLDSTDPDLVARLSVLQDASARPLRVIGAGPGSADRVQALTGALREGGAVLQVNGNADRAAVVAVLDRTRTGDEDVAAAVGALPDASTLVAVVLS